MCFSGDIHIYNITPRISIDISSGGGGGGRLGGASLAQLNETEVRKLFYYS